MNKNKVLTILSLHKRIFFFFFSPQPHTFPYIYVLKYIELG